MTMKSEAPDSQNPSIADAIPPGSADLLRTLLDTPMPKDEAWQAKAGRAVSMLAVGFLSESSDESALRSVALVGLAHSLGVKEARKRQLKLTRWAEAAPPPLATLPLKDEQHAALAGLARVTAGWTLRYVEQALVDQSLHEEFVPDLLKWARSKYLDSLTFVQEFYVPQVTAAKTHERTAALFKEAPKLLKHSGADTAAGLAKSAAVLVETIVQRDLAPTADDKAFVSGVVVLLHLVQDQAAACPAILLQPTFVMAFGRLSGAASKGAASKQVAAVAHALSLATASLLTADIERQGSQAARHWKAMVPTWRAAYAGWDTCFATAVKLSPALAAIEADGVEEAEGDAGAYAAEADFARLLPAWNAFVADLPDASRAASLSTMLLQAAQTQGITPMGEAGAVVSYDPLSHHLTEEGGASPNQVRILRSGVQVLRADGSARVLVAALVAAA